MDSLLKLFFFQQGAKHSRRIKSYWISFDGWQKLKKKLFIDKEKPVLSAMIFL